MSHRKTYNTHAEKLAVLYEDNEYIAINKPVETLVHRSPISEDTFSLLQLMRRQLGRRVYPVHRLDRATSGVLVWGKTSEAAGRLAALFYQRTIQKIYLAIVRGWTDDSGEIDYPIKPPNRPQTDGLPAQTTYQTLARSEKPWAIHSRYTSARFSLVLACPKTGRWHQIRRHLTHLRHPIIGDKHYGDNKHNKFFRDHLGIHRLLLHAWRLTFVHPTQGIEICIEAPLDEAFSSAIELLSLECNAINLLSNRAKESPAKDYLQT